MFFCNYAAILARYVDCIVHRDAQKKYVQLIFQKSRPMQDSVVTADVRNGSLMPVWF